MTVHVRRKLLEAIAALFDAVTRAGDDGPDDLVELLDTVDALAGTAARDGGYLPQRHAGATDPRVWGRRLQAHELDTLGITAVLRGRR